MTTTTNKPSISVDDLTADGFREFQIPVMSRHYRLADRFYQRCIRGEGGQKLYYVNAYLYDWRKYDKPGPAESLLFEIAADADGIGGHIKLDFSPAADVPLADVLAYLHRAWEALSGVPYEREAAS